MNIRRYLILGWMVAGLQILVAGQDQAPPNQAPPNPTPQSIPSSGSDSASSRSTPAGALSGIAGMQGEGGAEDTGSAVPQIPPLLGGKAMSSAVVTQLEKSNYLRAGVNVGAVYDDNPLLLSGGAVGNTSGSIFPTISIEQSSSRIRWSLGYAGGLTINQRFTEQNQGSHNLNFDSEFRLSPHVNLRVAETFSVLTGFFDAGNVSDAVATTGGPNASLIVPLSTQRSSLTTVETNYHFALNDLVGGAGSFYDLHFSNPSQGTPLTELSNSQTASGSAFWLHRIFRGDWGGASYRFDRLTVSPGGGETRAHSFFVVNTVTLANRYTLTAFAGPQYSENQGLVATGGGGTQVMQSNNWSVAGGIEGGWQNQHTSLFGGYSRSISDGGGVLGAVLLQSVHANFRHEIFPGWAAAINASHGTNRSLFVSQAGTSSIDLTTAGIALERNVGKSIGLRLGYSHDFQQQYFAPPIAPPTLDAHRNRFFVTLSYQWAKPLGM